MGKVTADWRRELGITIGFIGLGTMGRPMALNLLRAGYELRIYNRTESKAAALVPDGAVACESCEDAARGASVVITMLSDSPVVKEAILGELGALKGSSAGSVFIDMSTISPTMAIEIAQECKSAGVEFLDAPVSGGESGAIVGTLSVMVGGSKEAFERTSDVLNVLSSKITYMGESGKGQAAKLCNQVICGLNILATCEGLALGKSLGLDLQILLDAISGGAAGSWMLSNLAPKMIANDWAPGFRIALQQKDIRLALESAAEKKLPLVGTATVQQLFRSAEAMGFGEEGTQALFRTIKTLAALE